MEELKVDSNNQTAPSVSTVDKIAQIREEAKIKLGQTPATQKPETVKIEPPKPKESEPEKKTPLYFDESEKPEPKPPETENVTYVFEKDMISNFFTSIFDIASLRLGEHWKITETEANMLADPTKRVLDKYSVKATPEFMLLTSALVVVAPRIVISIAEKNARKIAEPATEKKKPTPQTPEKKGEPQKSEPPKEVVEGQEPEIDHKQKENPQAKALGGFAPEKARSQV